MTISAIKVVLSQSDCCYLSFLAYLELPTAKPYPEFKLYPNKPMVELPVLAAVEAQFLPIMPPFTLCIGKSAICQPEVEPGPQAPRS